MIKAGIMEAASKVRLFYLNDALKSEAEELRNLFVMSPNYTKSTQLDPGVQFSAETIPSDDIKLLTFNDFIVLMEQEDLSSKSDIVVILGHSNAFNFGTLAISDIMETLLHPEPPFLVVFLGCCGGNARYGPLTMFSQLPEWQNTVFSFFQRRIYKDELCYTVPVLGIQYYLHLLRQDDDVTSLKKNIRDSFGCAYADIRCNLECRDSVLFLNAKDEQATAQKLLDIFNTSDVTGSRYSMDLQGQNFSRARELYLLNAGLRLPESLNISVEEIPLSCWQLEIYHTFTAETRGEYYIRTFIGNFKRELAMSTSATAPPITKEMLIDRVRRKCEAELERRKLYQIIELASEIQLLQVTEETFMFLSKNEWGLVDHLQFFVAMLHGYWGKNNYYTMRALAAYHWHAIMQSILNSTNGPSENALHEYHLCSVGVCLFSPEFYIVFPNQHQYFDFLVWIDDSEVEIPLSKRSVTPLLKKFGENELPWVDMFHLRKKDCRFVKLFKEQQIDCFYMHSDCKYDCTDHTKNCAYEYKHEDLEMALKALQDYFFPSSTAAALPDNRRLKNLYDVRHFRNKENKHHGDMQSFKPINRIECSCTEHKYVNTSYVEMRVVHVQKKLKDVVISNDNHLKKNAELITRQMQNWKKISRCRFVFQFYHAKINGRDGRRGVLFFTDSHYGDDKIEKDKLKEELNKVDQNSDDVTDKNYFDKVAHLANTDPCRYYNLLQKLVDQKNYYPLKKLVD